VAAGTPSDCRRPACLLHRRAELEAPHVVVAARRAEFADAAVVVLVDAAVAAPVARFAAVAVPSAAEAAAAPDAQIAAAVG
jgi:hypothetical protein